MTLFEAYAIYGLAWAGFGAGHSLLAATAIKARLDPLFGTGYRLAYNLFALISIAAVAVAGWHLFRAFPPFGLAPWPAGAMIAVEAAGWIVLVAGLSRYDLGRFAGTAQLRAARAGTREPEDEPLRTDGLHRWVRHPIYLGGLLILWGRIDDHFDLATAAWGTIYLLVGMILEERKLLRLYGEAYARYRARVPALIPWKGRGP